MAQRLVGSSGSGSDCHIAGLLAGRRRFRPSAMILDRLWWISIQFSTICTNKLRGAECFSGRDYRQKKITCSSRRSC